jgi:hypothetical protein
MTVASKHSKENCKLDGREKKGGENSANSKCLSVGLIIVSIVCFIGRVEFPFSVFPTPRGVKVMD